MVVRHVQTLAPDRTLLRSKVSLVYLDGIKWNSGAKWLRQTRSLRSLQAPNLRLPASQYVLMVNTGMGQGVFVRQAKCGMGNNALLPSLRVLMVRSGLGLNVFVRQAKVEWATMRYSPAFVS